MSDFPYQALTFDCFGTLINWRRGQKESLSALPELHGLDEHLPELHAVRMEEEQRMQAGPWRPYSEILADSLRLASHRLLRIELSAGSCHAFSQAQAHWPAFPDSADALQRLAKRCTIGLLSNCDAAPLRFAATETLGLESPVLVPSEAIRSYKPAAEHWNAALRLLNYSPDKVLHVSAYGFYDLIPASHLGFDVAFIARDSETPPAKLKLAYQAHDLADLADQLGC